MKDYLKTEEHLKQLGYKTKQSNEPSNKIELPKLLNQKEVAALLRKPPRWLERKRWEGGGPPFRYMGRTPVYEFKALLAWIEAQPVLKHTSEEKKSIR